MGQTCHKEKKNGVSQPVLRGLVRDVESLIAKCGAIQSIGFRFVSGYKGKSKVKIGSERDGELDVTVCDNEFGKQVLVVRTLDPSAVARALRVSLRRESIQVS